MIYSLLFSLLFLFTVGADSKKESPKITALFCDLPAGPVKISDLKNCAGVTLSIAPDAAEKYEGTKVIGYTIVISPKKSGTPPAVENVTGSAISDFARDRVAALVPGDLVILTNVKVQTKDGIEDLKKLGSAGAAYDIVAE